MCLAFKTMNSLFADHVNIYHGTRCVVQDLSFSFKKGQMIALMGPNGGGKSSLLNTLIGLHKSYKGSFGWRLSSTQTLALRPQDTAYLPQHTTIDHTFPLRVHQVVEMGLWSQKGLGRSLTKDDKRSAEKALEKVSLLSYARSPLSSLSGGQFQRMLFARMMLQNASLLLLDEPFSCVDEKSIEDLIVLLKEWVGEGKTLIVSQHSRSYVMRHFPQTLLLAQRFSRWGKTEDVVTSENLALAYDAVNLCSNSLRD